MCSRGATAGPYMDWHDCSLNAWLGLTLVDLDDNKDVASARAIGALGIDSWLPFMASAAVLLLATGLGGLRTGVLPKWLAIVTTVLGVCCLLGPTGFVVWFAMPVWCVVLGVVLMRRQSDAASSIRTPEAATV